MRVLVACEYSGAVRDAFAALGHDAMSCDLLPTESPGPHYQGDVRDVLGDGWDLMVAHPPCTYLSVSGMHWTTRGLRDPALTEEALEFVRLLMGADIPRIAIENPVSVISTRIRKPDQTIQPWMFGHAETKATCLWLKGLLKLVPTHVRGGDLFTEAAPEQLENRVHRMPPGPNRWKERSRTYPGIAKAMAEQWTRAMACGVAA
jgi:hypothetical protein